LSVYASYYEPWGYTPLESVAFRVPTITTDLAGFIRKERNRILDTIRHFRIIIVRTMQHFYSIIDAMLEQRVL